MKTIFKALLFIVVILGILAVYGTYLASSPEGTVMKYFDSCDDIDLNAAIACLDPKYEKAYNAGSSVLGGLIGVSIKDAADILPVFKDAMGYEKLYHAYDARIEAVDIYGNIVHPSIEKASQIIRGIANLTGAHARVRASAADPGTGIRGPVELHLKNFGREGWRIIEITMKAP